MTVPKILIDTSFLYAMYSPVDDHHQEAVAFGRRFKRELLIVPVVVLPEVTFLFRRDVSYLALIDFFASFNQSAFRIEGVIKEDLVRVHQIMSQYRASRFDLVDCCLMALAERLNITQIATYDRRDFSQFRPTHCEYLDLLPS